MKDRSFFSHSEQLAVIIAHVLLNKEPCGQSHTTTTTQHTSREYHVETVRDKSLFLFFSCLISSRCHRGAQEDIDCLTRRPRSLLEATDGQANEFVIRTINGLR